MGRAKKGIRRDDMTAYKYGFLDTFTQKYNN